MAVQTLDISPVGRVEGDLDVRVDIENGVVPPLVPAVP